MSRTLKMLMLGALFAAVPATFALAGPPADGLAHKLDRMTETLDLTDAQRADIQAIFQANREQVMALRTEGRTTMKALDAAIEGGASNDTIAELAIEAHSLRAEGRALRQDMRKQVGALLTPEQKAKAKALRAEHGGRGQGGGHGLREGGRQHGPRDGGFDGL